MEKKKKKKERFELFFAGSFNVLRNAPLRARRSRSFRFHGGTRSYVARSRASFGEIVDLRAIRLSRKRFLIATEEKL